MKEKGNTCIAKLTLVQICFSIHLLWFRLLLPPWEAWQRSYHFRGSPIHPFLSFSRGPYPWVSSSLLWPRLPIDLSPFLSCSFTPILHVDQRNGITEAWILCSKTQLSSTAHGTRPRLPVWLPTSGLTTLQKHLSLLTWLFGKLQAKAPHLWVPAHCCILSL